MVLEGGDALIAEQARHTALVVQLKDAASAPPRPLVDSIPPPQPSRRHCSPERGSRGPELYTSGRSQLASTSICADKAERWRQLLCCTSHHDVIKRPFSRLSTALRTPFRTCRRPLNTSAGAHVTTLSQICTDAPSCCRVPPPLPSARPSSALTQQKTRRVRSDRAGDGDRAAAAGQNMPPPGKVVLSSRVDIGSSVRDQVRLITSALCATACCLSPAGPEISPSLPTHVIIRLFSNV